VTYEKAMKQLSSLKTRSWTARLLAVTAVAILLQSTGPNASFFPSNELLFQLSYGF
jgi:hypothetical protein